MNSRENLENKGFRFVAKFKKIANRCINAYFAPAFARDAIDAPREGNGTLTLYSLAPKTPAFAPEFVDMLHIILYQPEIPPNTGNIIRLSANTGASLHLVGPLGFQLDHARVRRAGLDYAEMARVRQYADWSEFRTGHPDMRLWAFSTRGRKPYHQAVFEAGDGLLFGPETRGLPDWLLDDTGPGFCLRLPMVDASRSLNLSNTVAIGLYEAWRQLGFENGS